MGLHILDDEGTQSLIHHRALPEPFFKTRHSLVKQHAKTIHRGETFRADAITVEKVRQSPKMKIITNAELQEFKGDKFVKSLTYKELKTAETKELKTGGVFVEIGFYPDNCLDEFGIERGSKSGIFYLFGEMGIRARKKR